MSMLAPAAAGSMPQVALRRPRAPQDAACVYFVMQFVAGGELFRTLKQHGGKCGPSCKGSK